MHCSLMPISVHLLLKLLNVSHNIKYLQKTIPEIMMRKYFRKGKSFYEVKVNSDLLGANSHLHQ